MTLRRIRACPCTASTGRHDCRRAIALAVEWRKTALVIIDMQRDFMEPGGFGETLGNDVGQLARAVKPCAAVLDAARNIGMLVVHTREGTDRSGVRRRRSNAASLAAHRRQGTDGPHSHSGRTRTRHHSAFIQSRVKSSSTNPARARRATPLGDILKDRKIENLRCAASRRVCVNTTGAKPTIAATAASCWRIAAHPTFPNFTRWDCA